MLGQLTPGETACLEMVGDGLVSKDIARRLGVSPHTVDARLRSASKKLGTRSRFVAARMLAEARFSAGSGEPRSDSNLIYEDLSLPQTDVDGDKGVSAGEGDGPDDLEQHRPRPPVSRADSGRGRGWLEPSHPIAKFFGGENRLSIGERLLIICAIALAVAFAFGLLVNGAIGLSRMLASP